MPNGTDESVKSLCPNDTDEHEKNYTHKKKTPFNTYLHKDVALSQHVHSQPLHLTARDVPHVYSLRHMITMRND